MRWAILFLFFVCAVSTHRRGSARHGSFSRQIFDHSTFTAPLNRLTYLFASVPNTFYIPSSHIPELALLKRKWQIFREEALVLAESSRIQATEKYNDIGFNSFLRTGGSGFIRGIA